MELEKNLELEKLKIGSLRLYFFEMKNTLFCFFECFIVMGVLQGCYLKCSGCSVFEYVWLFLLDNKRIKNAR